MRNMLRKLVFGIALLLIAATWPRDDSGTPSAQCSFIGSDGTPTLCSTLSPLPTGAGQTTAETDPTGWGKNFFQSTGSLGTGTSAAVFVGERTVRAWDASGANIQAHVSTDGGRAFALISSAFPGGDGIASVNAALSTSAGFFVGGNVSPGPSGNDGLWRSSDGLATWVAVDLPGTIDAGVNSLHAQGATVLALANTGVGNVCRSTNSGTSFSTCTDHAVFGMFGPLGIASPSAGIWLVVDTTGNIGRSTDDGLTFTSVLAMGGGPRATVVCLSATVCLATNATESIRRSVNGGTTWTTVFTAGINSDFSAFLNFGSGVVTVHGQVATTPPVFRSADFGSTWTFQVAQVVEPTSNGYNSAVTSVGRGFLAIDAGTGDSGLYSPIVGAGETLIAGQNGNRWEINASGEGRTSAVIRDATQANAAGVSAGGRLFVGSIESTGDSRTCSEPAANTAATITVTGVASQRVFVHDYIAFYTTAPAAAQTLTIVDGAANVWLDIVNGANTPTRFAFVPALRAITGNTVTLTLPAGGAGVVGKLCAVTTGPFIP